MKKLALVLGGGASKGYAHIGVLKCLEDNGIIPDLIVGTSMGALVGGMYALGKSPEELKKLSAKINSLGHFDIISTIFKENVMNINKVRNLIIDELKDKTYEDCRVKFVSVATELNTGREKHFDSGSLSDGIIASISIPAVFPRVQIGENYYCDGGLVNNLPENVARELMPDAVILSIDVIGNYAEQVEDLKFKTVEVILNASTLMTSNVIKNRPQDADIRITMTMPNVSQLDFTRETSAKTIELGEIEMYKYLDDLKKLLKRRTNGNTRKPKNKSKE